MPTQVEAQDYKDGATITVAPIVIKDIVITGISGGEFGVRGRVSAFDVNTGKHLWTGYSTGPDSEVLLTGDANANYPSHKGKDLGISTWQGDEWKRGGGTTWGWYTYDPDGNPIYLIGAAMPDPTITATTPITIPMFTTSGARFGAAFNPAHVVTTPWGSVTLRFLGCNLLNVKYEPAGASWGASSSIVMRRFLARAPGNSCP